MGMKQEIHQGDQSLHESANMKWSLTWKHMKEGATSSMALEQQENTEFFVSGGHGEAELKKSQAVKHFL